MEIDGKDFLDWLHDVRKKNKQEREKKRLSHAEWSKGIREEAEKRLGFSVKTLERAGGKKNS